MVLPFALVIAVGCHYLFLFLSIHTASYSPCLQHVQSAKAAVSVFEVYNHFTLTMAHFMRSAIATMVMSSLAVMDSTTLSLTLRLIWDPDIHPGIRFTACCVNIGGMVYQFLAQDPMMSPPVDPVLSACCDGVDWSSPWCYPVMTPCSQCMSPFVNYDDVFHYSHPVLSRPTVPNIWHK